MIGLRNDEYDQQPLNAAPDEKSPEGPPPKLVNFFYLYGRLHNLPVRELINEAT
jgi:hypothetical protein